MSSLPVTSATDPTKVAAATPPAALSADDVIRLLTVLQTALSASKPAAPAAPAPAATAVSAASPAVTPVPVAMTPTTTTAATPPGGPTQEVLPQTTEVASTVTPDQATIAGQVEAYRNSLWNFLEPYPFRQALWTQLEDNHLLPPKDGSAGQAPTKPQVDTNALFAGMTAADAAAFRAALQANLNGSPLGAALWPQLGAAGLLPPATGSTLAATPAATPAVTAPPSGATPAPVIAAQPSGAAPAPMTTTQPGGTAPAPVITAQPGGAAPAATAQPGGGASAPAATAPPKAATGTPTGTTGNQPATQPAAPVVTTAKPKAVSAVGAAGEDPSYSHADLKRDLTSVLKGRPGVLSNRALGRDNQINAWTDAKIDELYKGIQTAQQFFPQMAFKDLAQMVLAEGAQESSGDFNLLVGGAPGDGQGFMQATQQSVIKDFNTYGTPIKGPDGSVVLAPSSKAPAQSSLASDPQRQNPAWMSMAGMDMGNLTQNVAIWAWYSANSAAIGTSLDEALQWKHTPKPGGTFGDAQFAWNQGPSVRNTDKNSDYTQRLRDYYVQAGFGTAAQFDKLQATALPQVLRNVNRPLPSAAAAAAAA